MLQAFKDNSSLVSDRNLYCYSVTFDGGYMIFL